MTAYIKTYERPGLCERRGVGGAYWIENGATYGLGVTGVAVTLVPPLLAKQPEPV